jgi:hypothetical protein
MTTFRGRSTAMTRGACFIEVFPDAVLQQGHVHDAVALGHTDAVAEIADGGRGVAPAPQAADGGHARVVPAAHMALSTSWISLRLLSTV